MNTIYKIYEKVLSSILVLMFITGCNSNKENGLYYDGKLVYHNDKECKYIYKLCILADSNSISDNTNFCGYCFNKKESDIIKSIVNQKRLEERKSKWIEEMHGYISNYYENAPSTIDSMVILINKRKYNHLLYSYLKGINQFVDIKCTEENFVDSVNYYYDKYKN